MKFLNHTPVKLTWLTASFVVIGILGLIPLWIVQYMYQTATIKIIIAVSGAVWALATILWIFFASNYIKLWQKLSKELRGDKMKHTREKYPKYMELMEKYPMSINRHEGHYLKKRPRVPCDEIVAKALRISDAEWAEREEWHRNNRDTRKEMQSHKPPSLNRKGADNGQRL